MNNTIDIIYGSIILFDVKNSKSMIISDILTGKTIKFKHARISESNLMASVKQLFDTCCHATGQMPGTVMLIGYINETEDAIWVDWSLIQPIISFMSFASIICYTERKNNKPVFFDTVTSKIVSFKNLDSNRQFAYHIDLFSHDANYNNYLQPGNRRVLISGKIINIDENEIVIDANNISDFGDREILYASALQNIIGAVPLD